MSDWTWPFHAGSGVARKPRLIVAQFGNGYTQLGKKGNNNPMRTITWRVDAQSVSNLNAIDSFLESKVGLTFTVTLPEGGSELTVYVPEDGWEYGYDGGLIVDIHGTMIQVPTP